MSTERVRPAPPRLALLALFAAGLFGVAWASLMATRQIGGVASVWPVDALVVATLVRATRSGGERLAVQAVAGVAILAANLVWGAPPLLSILLVAINLAEIAAVTWLVRRVGRPVESPAALLAFIAGPVLLAPVCAAAAAALVFAVLVPDAEPMRVFVRWAYSEGLGMAIVGSLALTVRRRSPMVTTRRGWVQFGLAQALVLGAATVIMVYPPVPPLFLIYPFLLAGTLSHREFGGVTSVALVAAVVVATTLLGQGPAQVAAVAMTDRTQLMQVFLGSMVLAVLPVSALLRRLDATAAELDEKRAAAVALDAAKTKLLSYVSHEIRSPLSGVTALAQMMRDGALGELTAEQRDTMAQIAATGAQVDQLASDLTDVAALRAGKAPVRMGAVHVGEAIEAAVAVARFRGLPYGCEFQRMAGEADAAAAAADPQRLRQILVNLLVNGAKYGGRPPRVRISARLTGAGSVRFEVCDNGPGIPEERRAGLFQDFHRLGAEGSSIEGVGLGLALSNEIARLQQGALGVGDGELGGALFWLDLPLWRGPAGPIAA
jgi:signal transduction histidine kinase